MRSWMRWILVGCVLSLTFSSKGWADPIVPGKSTDLKLEHGETLQQAQQNAGAQAAQQQGMAAVAAALNSQLPIKTRPAPSPDPLPSPPPVGKQPPDEHTITVEERDGGVLTITFRGNTREVVSARKVYPNGRTVIYGDFIEYVEVFRMPPPGYEVLWSGSFGEHGLPFQILGKVESSTITVNENDGGVLTITFKGDSREVESARKVYEDGRTVIYGDFIEYVEVFRMPPPGYEILWSGSFGKHGLPVQIMGRVTSTVNPPVINPPPFGIPPSAIKPPVISPPAGSPPQFSDIVGTVLGQDGIAALAQYLKVDVKDIAGIDLESKGQLMSILGGDVYGFTVTLKEGTHKYSGSLIRRQLGNSRKPVFVFFLEP